MEFGEHRVLDGVELTVMHGERVGVVGEATGKSVMLKTLVGELMPTWAVWVGRPSGSPTWRRPGALDPDSTPLATLRASFPGTEEQAVAPG